MKRSPLNRISKRRKEQIRNERPVVEAIRERSDGLCEYPIKPNVKCGLIANGGIHEILPRGRGGKRTLSNCINTCMYHHWVTVNKPEQARGDGALNDPFDRDLDREMEAKDMLQEMEKGRKL